ncbi:hypothetical protein ADK18_24445 [Bacillus anthracis]|nr:hypothetical protein ADK17_25610 [Bacillus anthracis]KOS25418.1 hypothetical protein ADK18_24445 [Bacillus anthracis]
MAKFSSEEKIQAVKRYLEGTKDGKNRLAKSIKVQSLVSSCLIYFSNFLGSIQIRKAFFYL